MLVADFQAELQGHERNDHLPGRGIVGTDYRRLCHARMVDERGLHLSGGNAVARHVHDIVDPPEQPKVPVVVDLGPVACEVATLETAPVRLPVPLRVAVDAPQHGRPGPRQCEVPAAAFELPAGVVDDLGPDPRQREGRASRLQGRDAGQRRDHDGTGLGLPPRVDDRAAAAADLLPVPDPCLGVDRLTNRAEHPQARQIVCSGVFRPPLHEGADGRRRRVQRRDSIALDDRPPAVPAREIGRALVENARGTVRERPVDDVAVAGDPPDVGGAPIDIGLGLQVENCPVCEGNLGQVATSGVHDPLRAGRRARGVQQEKQVLGVHRLRGAVRVLAGHQLVPPMVSPLLHDEIPRGVAEAANYEHVLNRTGTARERVVSVGLQFDGVPASPASVGGDEQPGARVLDPIAQGVGGEAPEHHRVRRPDPRARQHRDGKLRNHRHVDRDAVTSLDAQGAQRVGAPPDLVEELRIGDRATVSGLAFEIERNLVADAGLDVTVEAVERDVQPATDEPPRERQLPIEHLVPRLEPSQGSGLRGPELLGVGLRLLVHRPVGDERRSGELLGRRECPQLGKVVLDRGALYLAPISGRVGHHRLPHSCAGTHRSAQHELDVGPPAPVAHPTDRRPG